MGAFKELSIENQDYITKQTIVSYYNKGGFVSYQDLETLGVYFGLTFESVAKSIENEQIFSGKIINQVVNAELDNDNLYFYDYLNGFKHATFKDLINAIGKRQGWDVQKILAAQN